MPSSGFATNTTISDGWWWYKPDPTDQTGKEIIVDTDGIQYIEATADHNKCWLYFAASDVTISQRAYILEGAVAQAFLSDMESLFV